MSHGTARGARSRTQTTTTDSCSPPRVTQLAWVDRQGREIGVFKDLGIMTPFPDLSPDEKQILICSGAGPEREVWAYDVEADSRRRLTFNERREDAASWHPNGDTRCLIAPPLLR